MSQQGIEYQRFVRDHVEAYAEMQARAGNWPRESALRLSHEEYAERLDDQLRRQGHRFFKAINNGVAVASLWEGPPPEVLDLEGIRWLYQITVNEELRRRGRRRGTCPPSP